MAIFTRLANDMYTDERKRKKKERMVWAGEASIAPSILLALVLGVGTSMVGGIIDQVFLIQKVQIDT